MRELLLDNLEPTGHQLGVEQAAPDGGAGDHYGLVVDIGWPNRPNRP